MRRCELTIQIFERDLGEFKKALKDVDDKLTRISQNKEDEMEKLRDEVKQQKSKALGQKQKLDAILEDENRQARARLEKMRQDEESALLGHGGARIQRHYLMFILDKSGSMCGEPWSNLKLAFEECLNDRKQACANLQHEDVVQVIMFNDTAKAYGAKTLSSCKDELGANDPCEGQTSFDQAFQVARQEVMKAKQQKVLLDSDQLVVIFMTDGQTKSTADLSSAIGHVEKMYDACSGKMRLFGISLLPPPSWGFAPSTDGTKKIVRAGNNGSMTGFAGDQRFDLFSEAGTCVELKSAFKNTVRNLWREKEEYDKTVELIDSMLEMEKQKYETNRKDIERVCEEKIQYHKMQLENAEKNLEKGSFCLHLERQRKDIEEKMDVIKEEIAEASTPMESAKLEVNQQLATKF